MTRRHFCACLATILGIGVAGRALADKYPKLAPYTAVRWKGDAPEVEVGDRFYRLRSIDRVTVDEIVDFAKKTYEGRWRKRLSEDLVQVMTEMGHPPGDKVTLRLADIDSKSEIVRVEAMTHENRQKVWRANQKGGI